MFGTINFIFGISQIQNYCRLKILLFSKFCLEPPVLHSLEKLCSRSPMLPCCRNPFPGSNVWPRRPNRNWTSEPRTVRSCPSAMEKQDLSISLYKARQHAHWLLTRCAMCPSVSGTENWASGEGNCTTSAAWRSSFHEKHCSKHPNVLILVDSPGGKVGYRGWVRGPWDSYHYS